MRYYINKNTKVRYRLLGHNSAIECASDIHGSWIRSVSTTEEFLKNLADGIIEPDMAYFRHKTSQVVYRINHDGELELKTHGGVWHASSFTFHDIENQVEEIGNPGEEPETNMTTLSLTERLCRQKAAARGFTLPAWLNKGPTPTMSLQQWETNFNTWFNQKVKENGNGAKYSPPGARDGFQSFRQKVADPSGVQGSPHCC